MEEQKKGAEFNQLLQKKWTLLQQKDSWLIMAVIILQNERVKPA